MKVEQFVMAYGAEQDRLRAMIPDGFTSLRPVLRINAEVIDGERGYLEFNVPVARGEVRGWLNIAHWDDIEFEKSGDITSFKNDMIEISFTCAGAIGGCPAEKDNAGCFFYDGEEYVLRKAETINANKEFCDCEFKWTFAGDGAGGKSIGKTIPVAMTESKTTYPRVELTARNAAVIPCQQVLGTYVVEFER